MALPVIQTSFSKGEIAPSLWGHVDLALWHTAAATMRNCFAGYRGGAYSRAGTMFVGRTKEATGGVGVPRIITWAFNNTQGYAVEFGNRYARFIFQGGQVLEPAISITGASQANPCVITAANSYSAGDWVALNSVNGMTQLNGNTYIVASPTASSFSITDLDGNPINSTGFGAYTGNGMAARIYTIQSPYADTDLALLKFAQSADVMSITHPLYPQYDLKRLGPTNWTLTPTSFGASIVSPTGAAVVATVTAGSGSPPTLPTAYAYVVTAIDALTGQESTPSNIANVTNAVDMAATNGANVVTWGSVTSAAYYKIYRAPTSYNTKPGDTSNALPVPVGALFGFVGQAFGTQFVDNNITPNFSQTPPQHRNPFAPGQVIYIQVTASSSDWTGVANVTINSTTGSGFFGQVVVVGNTIVAVIVLNAGQGYAATDPIVFSGSGTSAAATATIGPQTGTYPGVVSYFQERRVYAQTLNLPDTYNLSQPGAFTNFDSGVPINDSDAISGTPWSEKVEGIQWMLTMPLGLLTFTGAGVWQIAAPGSFASSPAAITPSNQIAAPQSSIGCSATVPPVKINWDVIYLESYGQNVLDLSYQIFFNIYAGTDISWPSSHLLQNHSIIQWAYARNPYKILWAAREDGVLLSLTYLKEQEVTGWARHDTLGQVRSLCVVAEPPVDALYLIVERPIPGGGTRFFIERMENRLWNTVEDPWCVDAAVANQQTSGSIPSNLYANSSSGAVVFTAAPGTFVTVAPGGIMRSGGGIAVINSQVGSTTLNGTWLVNPTQLYPNDPLGRPLPQVPGAWRLSTPRTTFSGLSHLVGQTVVGLADGVPVGTGKAGDPILTVSAAGTVTLPFAASKVVIGLGFTAQLQSVYVDTGNPTIQGRRKAISGVTVRMENSALCQVGTNQIDASAISPMGLFATWTGLTQATAASVQPSPPATYTSPGGATVQPLFTGDQYVKVQTGWAKPGQVAVQQTLPLPLQVTALIPELLPGDEIEVQITPRAQRGSQQRAP